MIRKYKTFGLFVLLAVMFALVGQYQSWNTSLGILNSGLLFSIMALGLNMQWGYAGLFNAGIMGFTALGGLAVALMSAPLDPGAWQAGGFRIILGLVIGALTIYVAIQIWQRMVHGRARTLTLLGLLLVGFFLYRGIFDPGVSAVEAITPASTGNIGGLGLPVLLAWPVGGLLAAAAAWIVAKTALGLRSDYLAIATLGIAEIVLSVMKNEDWLARGVKNIIGLPRPVVVPFEVDLQQSASFLAWCTNWGFDPQTASSIVVKLLYGALFTIVLAILIALMQMALHSPWGRMMRAIRDNEIAAEAMGKDVKRRHLQVFILGCAVIGIGGAMLVTLNGQLTPTMYQPLQYTFTIWVMVIIGGSGNNWGAVLGGMLVWFLWNEVEPGGQWMMQTITSVMPDGVIKSHLIDSTEQMRYLVMGVLLLLALRFSPRGLVPEE